MSHTSENTTSGKAEYLLMQALELPRGYRALLADSLEYSLGPEMDPKVEKYWAKELARRMKDLVEARGKSIPWEEVKAKLLRVRKRRRRKTTDLDRAWMKELRRRDKIESVRGEAAAVKKPRWRK